MTRLSTDELIEEVAWLGDANTSAALICSMLNLTAESVAHRLRRAGRMDLAAPFWDEVHLRRSAK